MPAPDDAQIAANWKNTSFIEAFRRRKAAQREFFKPEDESEQPDETVDDGGDELDDLGGWYNHAAEERRLARSLGARRGLNGRHGRGSASNFALPEDDPCSPGSWLNVARSCGASANQLLKASAMDGRGLKAKARRQAFCSVVGARCQCVSFEPGRSEGHKFFRRYACRNRYCPICGPKLFRDLFCRYVKLEGVVSRLVPDACRRHERAYTIAKIDFTAKKLDRMPRADEVRSFNRAIKKFFRLVESHFAIERSEYGAIWCNEFGADNSNLHSHAMYAGNYLPNRGKSKNLLSRLWRQACKDTPFAGSFIISIKRARGFIGGLLHVLKYAGKCLSTDPERLADLEAAFHKVRRVHTIAAFYNAPLGDDGDQGGKGSDGSEFSCPVCGAALVRVGSLCSVALLLEDGYVDLDIVRRERGRAAVLGARASPESTS